MPNRSDSFRFTLGQVVATPGAIAACREASRRETYVTVESLISRHHDCDWGSADAEANEDGLDGSDMLISIFDVGGTSVWVKTEYDRSVTTVYLPSED